MLFGYLMGYLASAPEERMTAKGKRVVQLRLGVKTRSTGKEETVWCKCNIWHDRYDKMLPYLNKGSSLIVCGEITVESYLSRDGTPRSSIVVHVDTLKFGPTASRKDDKDEVGSHGGIGFNGENLDDAILSEDQMYAGSGNSLFVEEDIPF